MGLFRRRRDAEDDIPGFGADDGYTDGYHDHDGYDDHDEFGDDYDDYGLVDPDRFPRDHRGGRLRSCLGCLLPLALVAGLAGGGYYGYLRVTDHLNADTCRVHDDKFDYRWSTEQSANAATIATIGTHKRGLPMRASQIALATAIQESKIRNLTHGDADSLGLFQQRPSQGWGTPEEINDPVYASEEFYRHLVKVPQWQSRPLTVVAQEVQKSAYPEAYADHETQGRVLATAFDGSVPEGIACRMGDPTEPGDPQAFAGKLTTQTGARADVAESMVTYRGSSAQDARAIGAYAVAHAQANGITSVIVGDRAWDRQSGEGGWSWTDAKNPTGSDSVVRIEF